MAQKTNSTAPLTALAIERMGQGQTKSDSAENRGLRVTKLGRDVRYWYRYLHPHTGKKVEMTIAYGSRLSLAEVRVVFAQLKAQRKMGQLPELPEYLRPCVAKEEVKKAYFSDELLDDYLVESVDKRRSGKAARECSRILNKAREAWAGFVAEDITLDQCLSLAYAELDRGCNAQTGVLLRELAAAFEHAIIRRRLPLSFDNPAQKAHRMLKREGTRLTSKRRKRYLTDHEISLFLSWLPKSGFSKNQKIALQLTLQTGCRTGEAISAAWKDFDLDRGVWSLPKNKTDMPRELRLASATVKWLKEIKGKSDIFLCQSPRENKPIQQRTLASAMWQMRTKGNMLDIPEWVPHDLRRSVRTGLARLRCPQPVAEAILGHSADNIVATYNLHGYSQEIHEWLENWNAHLHALNHLLTD
jgi:integrase